MSTTRRLVSLGIGAAAAMLINGAALGQALPSASQKCIDGYNNKLRLVSAQAGKSAVSCVKNAAKGSELMPDNCIVNNTDGKVGGKQQKVADLYTAGKCLGTEPIQQGAAVGNAAHEDAIIDFAHDLYGDPVSGIVGPLGKNSAKCLQKATQRPTQAFTALVLAHRACKKNGMKAGTITDEATLTAACGTFAAIDSGGKAGAKFTKSATDIGAACGATEEPLSQLFSGLDAGCQTGATLAACINNAAKCRACIALNTADGMTMNCDTFDDGLANSSCGVAAPPIGTHACNLNTSSSSIVLSTQAFTLPPFAAGGSVDISCGSPDGNGEAACSCTITSFNPVIIPSIGDVCVNPYAGCPSGTLDCNGGAPQNTSVTADHNIGACASDTACNTACNSFCGTATQLLHGCEGFCSGGINNDVACTADTQCTGGQCVGAEPPSHVGVCNCACGSDGLGGASPAGSLSCAIGTQIDVELPSDGDCGDANTIVLPGICGPATTTTASGQIIDVNNNAGVNLPAAPSTSSGASAVCASMQGSTLTGTTIVSKLAFFDSTLGDILATNTFVCQ